MQSEVVLGKMQTSEMEKRKLINQESCFSLKTFFWAITLVAEYIWENWLLGH